MRARVNPASPFARKVRVVLRERALSGQVEEIETAVSPVAPNADLARSNPLVKIPALILDDGTTLFDSRVICEYLDFRFPDIAWRSNHPRLAAWFEGVSQRPSVRDTAPKA